MEGAELGGLLEGGVDGDGGGFGGHDDAGYQFSSTGEEVRSLYLDVLQSWLYHFY
jgi:DNA topoisomerase 2-associated protein PAT1